MGNGGSKNASYPEVTVADGNKLTFGGGGWTYVDVRTAEEFKAGHPSGAVNIPMHVVDAAGEKQPNPHFKATLQNTFTDKNHQLVVGCRSGARSGKTCELLLGLGYKNVKNLEGGFMAWEEARLPTHKL